MCFFTFQNYVAYIKSLPINDNPEIFGLHDNANITFAQTETFNSLQALLLLQPKSTSGGGKSREEVGVLFSFLKIKQAFCIILSICQSLCQTPCPPIHPYIHLSICPFCVISSIQCPEFLHSFIHSFIHHISLISLKLIK